MGRFYPGPEGQKVPDAPLRLEARLEVESNDLTRRKVIFYDAETDSRYYLRWIPFQVAEEIVARHNSFNLPDGLQGKPEICPCGEPDCCLPAGFAHDEETC